MPAAYPADDHLNAAGFLDVAEAVHAHGLLMRLSGPSPGERLIMIG